MSNEKITQLNENQLNRIKINLNRMNRIKTKTGTFHGKTMQKASIFVFNEHFM